MLDQLKQSFLEEANELLEQLEEALLELESDFTNAETVSKVFRILHTVKGSAGMFGFDDVSKFTHDIENAFEKIRNGELQISKEIIELTLNSKDVICAMLDSGITTGDEKVRSIMNGFSRFCNNEISNVIIEKVSAGENQVSTFYIEFKPGENIFMNGTNPLFLLDEIIELGSAILHADFDHIPEIENFDPEKCLTSWKIFLSTDKGKNAIQDVFIFVEDECTITIEEISKEDLLNSEENKTLLQNILKEDLEISKEKFLPLLKNSGEKKCREEKFETVKETVIQKKENTANIKVSSEKLDQLVNLVGELVTVQARLNQISAKQNSTELNLISEEIERLTWDLRNNSLNLRMLPIGTIFNKFKRLVHDLSNELNKKVDFVTIGAETELDKNVIEKLNDPLVHIIRNCIDHGIENPEDRIQKGKPANGTVQLTAKHSGAFVVIEIKDNGAGLNSQSIKRKAIERGLIPQERELSENEIYNLIFMPGFSTARELTSISGRGVGMDVVRKTIEELKGIVEISSKENEGTTITLKLPLTLAIIEGLLLKTGDDNFVIPLSFVEECVEIIDREKNNSRSKMMNIRGELIPYIPLKNVFELKCEPKKIEQIIVVKDEQKKIGILVDEVIGEHQTVIKSLGGFYKNVELVSGATILGDGSVALILDVAKIINQAVQKEIEITSEM